MDLLIYKSIKRGHTPVLRSFTFRNLSIRIIHSVCMPVTSCVYMYAYMQVPMEALAAGNQTWIFCRSSVLISFSVAVIEQKHFGGEQICLAYTFRTQSVVEGRQGRNLIGRIAETLEKAAYRLAHWLTLS